MVRDRAYYITINHWGPQLSEVNFAKFCGPVRKIPRLTAAKLSKFLGLSQPSSCAYTKLYLDFKTSVFGCWHGAQLR